MDSILSAELLGFISQNIERAHYRDVSEAQILRSKEAIKSAIGFILNQMTNYAVPTLDDADIFVHYMHDVCAEVLENLKAEREDLKKIYRNGINTSYRYRVRRPYGQISDNEGA